MNDAILEEIEHQLRAGQLSKVAERLEKLSLSGASNRQVVKAANLARRCGQSALTLRWLKPRVYPKNRLQARATAEEIAEYAMGLQRFGAHEEAMSLLASFSRDDYPLASLYEAISLFSQWNYTAGLKALDSVLSSRDVDPYFQIVARVNRAAARVFLNDDSVEKDLANLLAETKPYGFLFANALEITAQQQIRQKDWSAVKQTLSEASATLGAGASPERMYIEKWTQVAEVLRTGDVKPLNAFRRQALKHGHWETLRDLDFHSLFITNETRVAHWLYWGTPYPAYREHLRRTFPALFVEFPQGEWVSRLADPDVKIDPLEMGADIGETGHRLLLSLLADFYRPRRIGEIFPVLFAERIFDLEAATTRVHQAVRAARALLIKWKWPARIEVLNGGYALRWTNPRVSIYCEHSKFSADRVGLRVRILARRFAEREFSAKDVAPLFDLSESQAQRFLKDAMELGILHRYGAGRKTLYSL